MIYLAWARNFYSNKLYMEISNIIFKKIKIVITFQHKPPYIHFFFYLKHLYFVK